MFTGIIEAVGTLVESDDMQGDRRFSIATPGAFLDSAEIGESIAVSGICLTVVALEGKQFIADVSNETLANTTASGWQPGDVLNLERSLTLAKPLGGHLVSGHVDGLGKLLSLREDARSRRLELEVPSVLARYVARKGSIAINGVSLTVNDVEGPRFGVNIVPHTWEQTSLGGLKPGDSVNIEVDLIARYTERLLAAGDTQ